MSTKIKMVKIRSETSKREHQVDQSVCDPVTLCRCVCYVVSKSCVGDVG